MLVQRDHPRKATPAKPRASKPQQRLAAVCLWSSLAACSLSDLSDGGTGGQGGQGSTTTSSDSTSTSTGQGGAGGFGGESPFAWLVSVGNAGVQGTSPYGGDPGTGSTLRIGTPDPSGAVWLGMSTRGAVASPAGGAPLGNPDSANLFFVRTDALGATTAFAAVNGVLENIGGALSLGGLVGLPDGGFVVVGSFFGGSLDFAPLGLINQSSLSQDDAFVVRFDRSGAPVALRHLTTGNHQSLRAVSLAPTGEVLVAGRFKRTLEVRDETGVPDASCSYSVPAENFERAMVLRLDPASLGCTQLVTLEATDDNATQQVRGIAADAAGVVLSGGFTRQLGYGGMNLLTASASEDGFVLKLDAAMLSLVFAAPVSSNRFSANDSARPVVIAGDGIYVGGYYERGTSAVMSMTPQVGSAAGVCELPMANERDGFLALLDPTDGACLGAAGLGGLGADEVRDLGVHASAGAWAAGFYSDALAGLGTPAGGRDGFVLRANGASQKQLSLTPLGVGGPSWDYVDGVRQVDGGLLIAGSYALPFFQLTQQDDFYVGLRSP